MKLSRWFWYGEKLKENSFENLKFLSIGKLDLNVIGNSPFKIGLRYELRWKIIASWWILNSQIKLFSFSFFPKSKSSTEIHLDALSKRLLKVGVKYFSSSKLSKTWSSMLTEMTKRQVLVLEVNCLWVKRGCRMCSKAVMGTAWSGWGNKSSVVV